MYSKITYLAFTSLFWVFYVSLSAQTIVVKTVDVVKNKNGDGFVEVDSNTTPTHTNPVSGFITVLSTGNFYKFNQRFFTLKKNPKKFDFSSIPKFRN